MEGYSLARRSAETTGICVRVCVCEREREGRGGGRGVASLPTPRTFGIPTKFYDFITEKRAILSARQFCYFKADSSCQVFNNRFRYVCGAAPSPSPSCSPARGRAFGKAPPPSAHLKRCCIRCLPSALFALPPALEICCVFTATTREKTACEHSANALAHRRSPNATNAPRTRWFECAVARHLVFPASSPAPRNCFSRRCDLLPNPAAPRAPTCSLCIVSPPSTELDTSLPTAPPSFPIVRSLSLSLSLSGSPRSSPSSASYSFQHHDDIDPFYVRLRDGGRNPPWGGSQCCGAPGAARPSSSPSPSPG